MKKLVLLGAVCLAGCDQIGPKAQENPHIGRYTIVRVPHLAGQAILLDTATGKTWSQVSTGTPEDSVAEWLPMDQTTLKEWINLKSATASSD